jgi:hypothetical protein
MYLGVYSLTDVTTNIEVYDNFFSTIYFPNSGTFGPGAFMGDGLGNVFDNNTWLDGPKNKSVIPSLYTLSPPMGWNQSCPQITASLPSSVYIACVKGTWNVYGNEVILIPGRTKTNFKFLLITLIELM